MTAERWRTLAHPWLGVVSGIAVLASSLWLLSVHLQLRWAAPAEKTLVDALKARARTDTEIQKTLAPELDRQTKAIAARDKVYRRGGVILLVSSAMLLAYLGWLRPARPRSPEALSVPSRFRPPPAAESAPLRLELATTAAPEAVDASAVDAILEAEGRDRSATIPVLQAIQSRFRYLPETALRRVCQASEITPAQLAGVATFYDQFRHRPVGRHVVRVCEGTACHVNGATEISEEVRRCLGIDGSQDTDRAGLFTIERVACVGSCSLAPVVTIDEKIWGRVLPVAACGLLADTLAAPAARGNGHRSARAPLAARRPAPASGIEIRIGLGSCGVASGALAVLAALEDELAALGDGAALKPVGCYGLCHREPLLEVVADGRSRMYGNVDPAEVRRIVRSHVRPRGLGRRLRLSLASARDRLRDDHAWTAPSEREVDATPFLRKQVRIVLENCGEIDPGSLEEYRRRDGMRALEQCLLRMTPELVIEEVRRSGLRGRGGAGFPTAAKWEIARREPGPKKYVICNGDEGDPGAFMDRAVLEGDPFRVVEGLAIAAYAIGADEGFVYVRREYPLAVRHVRAAIESAEAHGFLGERILGSSFRLELRVREGAGAFVCGEETALIQSIEGLRGMPRLRPPFPAESGLLGKPTVINNVETLGCLPWILRRGPERFAALGTERSKGSKVFSLAGKVNRGGLIEVPMGITLRQIVEEIGGGTRGGRPLKAVLVGGPSGGCIPARLADTRVDYEELQATGAIMGSGGLVVLDDRECAVEIARYFLSFTQKESCGKCTFCRIGSKRMLEVLERICAGKGTLGDLETLDELGTRVKKASLCGLGQTAPNPVLTTLRYFREEYEAHIRERRCPAARCKALIRYEVLQSCTGCTLCAQACPVDAIEARPHALHEVDDARCTRCGMCLTACPEDAIRVA